MEQQLSRQVQAALATVKALPRKQQAQLVSLVVTELAAEIARKVPTAPSQQRAEASSAIDKGIKTATHGFEQGKAPDGTAAIKVKIEDVTCLLSDGARGTLCRDLADYGTKELQGACLLTHPDFEAVAERLFQAMKGLKVVDNVLQTKDKVLVKAYQLMTQGVRRAGGVSWAVFDLDSERWGGVVCRRREVRPSNVDHRGYPALFGTEPLLALARWGGPQG